MSNKRKTISKDIRLRVYNSYSGHCAYCGCKIEYKEMQIDHINSVYRTMIISGNIDENINNYMPSCRQCNFYKSTFTLEYFRERLSTILINNLRKQFSYKLALKYGLIQEKIKPIKFYFEKIDEERVSEEV